VEIETIFGLPAHPLIVHVPVVLIPLCALGAVLMAFSPAWRHRIGWIVVVLAGVAVGASQLSVGSGEALEEALDDESELLERHAELGETFTWVALVFFLAVLALMIWDTMQRRKAAAADEPFDTERVSRSPLGIVLSIVVVLTAVGAGYRVYEVGHSGAEAVWQDDGGTPDGTPSEGGEHEEEDEEGATALRP
jgi:hypothetical protein